MVQDTGIMACGIEGFAKCCSCLLGSAVDMEDIEIPQMGS